MDSITNINELLDKWGNAIILYLPKVFFAILVVLFFYFIAKFLHRYSLKFYSNVFKKLLPGCKINRKGNICILNLVWRIYWPGDFRPGKYFGENC